MITSTLAAPRAIHTFDHQMAVFLQLQTFLHNALLYFEKDIGLIKAAESERRRCLKEAVNKSQSVLCV